MITLLSALLARIDIFQQYRPRPGDYSPLGGGPIRNIYDEQGGYTRSAGGGYTRSAPGGRTLSGDCGGDLPNPLGVCDLLDFVNKIIGILQIVAVPIVSIMILYGAFQIITSGGQSARAQTGGKTILYAAVGFGILLLADGVVAIIKSLLQ